MRTLDDQLREYARFADETLPWVDPADVMMADRVLELPVALPQERGRPGLWIAVAAATIVLFLVGGIALLRSPSGQDTPPADPNTTTTVQDQSTDSETYMGVPRIPTVPFDARVLFTDFGGDPIPGSDPEALLRYAGPGAGMRLDMVLFDTYPEGTTGPGSYVVFDGIEAASYLADLDTVIRFPIDEPVILAGLAEFGWDLWAQRCESGTVDDVAQETVNGRATTHLTCTHLRGSFEVWVDTNTGVVVRSSSTDSAIERPIAAEFAVFPGTIELVDIDFTAEISSADTAVELPPDTSELSSRVRRILVSNDNMTIADAIAAAEDAAPEVTRRDTVAPSLSGPLMDGGVFDLGDLKGSNVALIWWASWCPPSLDALQVANRLAAERPSIAFIAVSFNDFSADARAVIASSDITIPIIDTEADPDIDSLWQIQGCPTIALVDAEGIHIESHLGVTTHKEFTQLLANVGW